MKNEDTHFLHMLFQMIRVALTHKKNVLNFIITYAYLQEYDMCAVRMYR